MREHGYTACAVQAGKKAFVSPFVKSAFWQKNFHTSHNFGQPLMISQSGLVY